MGQETMKIFELPVRGFAFKVFLGTVCLTCYRTRTFKGGETGEGGYSKPERAFWCRHLAMKCCPLRTQRGLETRGNTKTSESDSLEKWHRSVVSRSEY